MPQSSRMRPSAVQGVGLRCGIRSLRPGGIHLDPDDEDSEGLRVPDSEFCRIEQGEVLQPAHPSLGGNSGKLLIDATCAPADIRYPTDIYMSSNYFGLGGKIAVTVVAQ